MSRMLCLSAGVLLAAVAAAQTPALRKGVSVQMPATASAVAVPDADLPDSVVVAVTASGAIYLDTTQVTPAQLSRGVTTALHHPSQQVYVKVDARTPYSTVAEVLAALRSAGVNSPVLLTSQQAPTETSYVTPKGLEVLLPAPPGGAPAVAVGATDAQLKQRARQDRPVVLQAGGKTAFGDVVHAIDVLRAAGARVYLGAAGK